MSVVRRLMLLLGAALLVWRIASTGLSAHYAQSSEDGAGAAVKALAWNDRNPDALYRRALELRGEDPQAAAALLARASGENPAAAPPLVALAGLAREQGDDARAQSLLEKAVELAPADPWVQRQAADYWVGRGDLEQALGHWSAALETDPGSRPRLFPTLMRLAEDPRTRPAFKPYAASPPSWWEGFFAEVAAGASEVETVRVLYTLRRESERFPVTGTERRAFVERMKRSGHIAEAYVDWVSGLGGEQRRQLGFLHDGGFELEPSNWGFDWRIRSRPQALVDRGTTYGIDGEKALHLLFRDYRGRFEGVSQFLFLDPGPYRLSGRVSTDSLESRGGIRWGVRCLLAEPRELGASERFLGANEWRDFAFEFEVPDSCVLQELRLVSAGERRFEQRITGGAWFDRLMIGKVRGPTAPPGVAAGGEAENVPKAGSEGPPGRPEE